MSKAEKYQRFAEACLEIASVAKDDKIKAALMHMAQVWLRLAASQPKEVEKDETSVGLPSQSHLPALSKPPTFVKNTLMTLSSGLIGQPVA
jgi:hypothetical protein